MRRAAIVLTAATFVFASCASSSDGDDTGADADTDIEADADAEADAESTPAGADGTPTGLVTVSPDEAAGIIDTDPDELVVLDVRTPEEFADGHLDDAVLIDFYDADFAEQLAGLDRDATYVLYCRSGNRSGEALGIMDELGFGSVSNVDGGILAWAAAGLPVVAD